MFKRLFFGGSGKVEKIRIGTDMHSHLIPGIDDGSKDLEDSLDMITGLAALGYERLITTPHILWDSYRNTPEIIRSGLDKVRVACQERNINIRIDAAAEYYIDEHFLELLRDGREMLTLPGNRLLVELPYSSPLLNTTETLFSIIGYGYSPVLAHPERYKYMHNQLAVYRQLTEQGCELQLNALSVIGYYGPGVQKAAQWLLKEKLITYLGTDTHNTKHVDALDKALSQKLLRNYDFLNDQL